jgi:DNA-binding MarR family transcriptional regulator/GNAT superfamily N-acetyltransferase
MEEGLVAGVRRFNRTVTERIGALEEGFLGRARSLGQSRVLWEIGPEGCDVRELRRCLALDSGYLSRILRALESEGLATVERSAADGRRRVARLTRRGRVEHALLDRGSDERARALLAPLSDGQRRRLVDAMAAVERLLTAGEVRVETADPEEPDAVRCISAYFAELDHRSETGFDPGAGLSATPEELRPPHGVLVLARLRGEAIGCGALKLHRGAPCEIKRMWVAEDARGLGLGRRLLATLEDHARSAGARVAHLETNRHLAEAIALYRSAGYVEVEPFNDEPFADHWFEKRLG